MTHPQDRTVATRVLFAAVALGTTSFVASLTVAPLVGEDLTGSATLSGLPWAAGVLGTGLGSALISQLMARQGRAPGLVLGYLLGGLGAGLAVVAITTDGFLMFVPAIFLMGMGNAANHLSRYAAADLYPPERRASGLSMVVWAGAVGGVGGPALLEPSGELAGSFDLPRLTGPFFLAMAGCGLAVVVIVGLVRLRPQSLVAHDEQNSVGGQGQAPNSGVAPPSGERVYRLWKVPRAQAALIALAASQTVMVMVMAMTPLHMRSHGHGLGQIGVVIAVHVFGMYGLSPLSGRLADRFGSVPIVLAGFATLMAATLSAAAAPDTAGLWLTIPLFLLGWGWSLSFVAGSVMLTEGLSYSDRARLQGATDSVVWTSAAIAGLSSGVLIESYSYAVLCLVGALLIVAPVLVITGRRRSLVPQPVSGSAESDFSKSRASEFMQ